MRLLDKYILSIFIFSFVLFLLVLLGLFVIVDFSIHIEDFPKLKQQSIILFIGKYYLYKLPFLVMLILPAITLFSAMFTLLRLSKANELVPMITNGISLHRISLIFIISAVLSGVVIAVLDELVLPALSDEITYMDKALTEEGVSHNIVASDDEGNYFFAKSYDHIQKAMEDVVVTAVKDGIRDKLIFAKKCQWDPSGWRLSDGKIYKYISGELLLTEELGRRPKIDTEKFGLNGYLLNSSLKPIDVVKAGSLVGQFYTFPEAIRLAHKYPFAPTFWMRIHTKLAFPLSALVLLLLGLPFITDEESTNIFKGLFLCLIVVLCYYAMHFFFLDLGNRGSLNPLLAAWLPTIAFGGFGFYLFWNIKT